MQDKMTMDDGFAMQMECGHPDTGPGKVCVHCGKVAPSDKLTVEYTTEDGKKHIEVHHGKPPADLEDQVAKQAEGHKPHKVDNITVEASEVSDGSKE